MEPAVGTRGANSLCSSSRSLFSSGGKGGAQQVNSRRQCKEPDQSYGQGGVVERICSRHHGGCPSGTDTGGQVGVSHGRSGGRTLQAEKRAGVNEQAWFEANSEKASTPGMETTQQERWVVRRSRWGTMATTDLGGFNCARGAGRGSSWCVRISLSLLGEE